MKLFKKYAIVLLILGPGLWSPPSAEAANSMATYVSVPTFLSTAVPPMVTIIFDNSGSMNQMAYWYGTLTYNEDTSQFDIAPSSPYDPNRNYYGYFVSGKPGNRVMYTYSSNKFVRSSTGEWEGNFLNWLCMRRVDVARKVLVGGKATSRSGGGNTTLIGEDPAAWGRSYKCKIGANVGNFPADFQLSQYTPFDDTERYFGVKDGYVYVSKDLNMSPFDKFDYQYYIKVIRDSSYSDEAEGFGPDGNIAGVMQKVGDKIYWGLEFFRYGTGGDDNGGYMKNRVGHPNITNLYTNIENEAMQNWTPLAESYYVAMQYYRQEAIDPTLKDNYSPGYQINDTWDPFYQNGATVPCAKGFVLLFTDGASTKDMMIPDEYKNYDGDGHDPNNQTPGYSYDGADYLDDIALYARTNDLRPDSAANGLPGDQNLELFVVYAFGSDDAARRLLKDAARNGGFIDRNGNDRPDPVSGTAVAEVDYTTPTSDDSWSEWWADKRTDSNGYAMPDTYFEAQDGWELERQLINAITKILERASSGTAVSVLATSGEGEGTLYQAYFKPKYSTATEDVYWTGYLHSLWVDTLGNLREDWTSASDPSPDGKLDLTVDPIVKFFFDEASGETKFERKLVSESDPYGETATPTTYTMTELSPLWEAGEKLASRSAASRTIYTFVDLDGDGVVDGNESLDSGELIYFTTSNQNKLKAYLDLANDTASAEEDFAYLGETEDYRVANLINYISGSDSAFSGTTNVRNRTAASEVWKLGDIVHSTPTPIGQPVDNYDIIYGDDTYLEFYKRHKGRETVVYSGANDGMLHAFLDGVFHPGPVKKGLLAGDGAYFDRDPQDPNDGYPTAAYGTTNKYSFLGDTTWRGAEIWAYIPQNLLPHLKWLADPDYTNANHVYYVDLKPRIFDARIYPDDENPDVNNPLYGLWSTMTEGQKKDRRRGWCTLLVGGMGIGGGSITLTGDFDNNSTTADTTRTFHSAYFAIDITDPLNPILLWERNFSNYGLITELGFTTSFPTVLKVDAKSVDTSTTPDTVKTDSSHWYLLYGSGPTPTYYDGTSTQNGRIFLVDLATGSTTETTSPGRIFTKLTNDDGTDSATSLPANGFMGSPVSVDFSLDYSVNVAYIGDAHEDSSITGGYGGGLYRLKVKTEQRNTPDASAEYTYYYAAPSTWTLSHMFDAERPITAAPGAAVAVPEYGISSDALWVYFGTGRYLAYADRTDTTQQYLYGVKDPYFNNQLTDMERTTLLSDPLTITDLYNATGVKVFTDGTTTTGLTFSQLKDKQTDATYFQTGWYRLLDVSRERIINKPSVLGGIVLAPSFVPNEDVCGFGGDSYLYALYFETGTAFSESVIGLATDEEAPAGEQKVLDKTSLGVGLASSLGIHVGREKGAKGFIQQSTGTVTEIELQPAFEIKSGYIWWLEE